MLHLKDSITDFQHNYQLLEPTRAIPAFKIARVHAYLPLHELQIRMQWAASPFADGPQSSGATQSMVNATSQEEEDAHVLANITDPMVFNGLHNHLDTITHTPPNLRQIIVHLLCPPPRHNRYFVCNNEWYHSYKHSKADCLSALRRPEHRPKFHATVHMSANSRDIGKKKEIDIGQVDEAFVSNVLSLSEDKYYDGTDKESKLND